MEAVLQKTIEMDPSSDHAHVYLAASYHRKGMFEETLAEYQRAKRLPKTTLMPMLGHLYADMGREDRAREILRESIEESEARMCHHLQPGGALLRPGRD